MHSIRSGKGCRLTNTTLHKVVLTHWQSFPIKRSIIYVNSMYILEPELQEVGEGGGVRKGGQLCQETSKGRGKDGWEWPCLRMWQWEQCQVSAANVGESGPRCSWLSPPRGSSVVRMRVWNGAYYYDFFRTRNGAYYQWSRVGMAEREML
jgi:hypothetical protein